MRLLELSVRSHFLSTLSARIFENANIATIGLHFVGFLKVRRRPRFETYSIHHQEVEMIEWIEL